MKKPIVIFCSTVALLIIGLYLIDKISESVIENDNKYINEILDNHIRTGMTPEQLNLYFKAYDRQLSLWECLDKNMRNGECLGERALVVTLPLPSDFFWLGKGDAQIYFYFNTENILEYFDYELYYSRSH